MLDRLWIGCADDFHAPLGPLGFTGVVDLRDGHKPSSTGVIVHHIDNRDGDPWTPVQVLGALDFVSAQLGAGRVLIGCAAGMSRSASLTIGYLVRTGWDVASAYEHVHRVRPQVRPVARMLSCVLEALQVPMAALAAFRNFEQQVIT